MITCDFIIGGSRGWLHVKNKQLTFDLNDASIFGNTSHRNDDHIL